MENGLKQIQELLPLPAAQLAEKFPYSGALQVLSTDDAERSAIHQALYFPFPRYNGPDAQPNTPAADTVVSSVPTNDNTPLFEPYHTIDYFASQGIKPISLENPTDRFGQQLKSFTDWLKVMKRLPLTEVTRQIPVEKEKQVADMALHSLDDKQVWTEAMAEVWAKQGEKQKAIQVYQKLSLLDPSKSAYFAGKIDELNSLS